MAPPCQPADTGGSLAGIIRDKALIVCSQAKEGLYLFLCVGHVSGDRWGAEAFPLFGI